MPTVVVILRLLRAECVQRSADLRMLGREHRGSEQPGISSACVADGEGRDRNAGRHLHDRQQRIHAAQRFGLYRHAEHRHRGFRREHAGQMRCTTGTGDDRAETTLLRGGGVLEEHIRGAVRGHDADFVRNAERFESGDGVLHRLPVGARAHHHADQGPVLHLCHGLTLRRHACCKTVF
jgi:hypothetical protein